ncbi:unnamed protein product, partial [Iphiclides podalirius]
MVVATVLLVGLLSTVLALPSSETADDPSCIRMTPENRNKLDSMMNEVVEFVTRLAARNQDFDVASLKMKIDRHYQEDDDTKDTVLEFIVNDCSSDAKEAASWVEQSGGLEGSQTPEVVWLNLPENGREVLRYLNRKRGDKPFLVYTNGMEQYVFP